MRLRALNTRVKVKNKRVLVRIGANVPLYNGRVDLAGSFRLKALLPTINYLRSEGAIIILIAHLGRPDGRQVLSLSLRPVADVLGKLLKKKIIFSPEKVGSSSLGKKVAALRSGEVMMLENIRFYPGEKKNSLVLARQLASLGDLYVNEAFSDAHRSHASIVALANQLPSYAGFRLIEEFKILTQAIKHKTRPLAVIVGGSKLETKLPVIEYLAPLAKYLLLGGDVANPLLDPGRLKTLSAGEVKSVRKINFLLKKNNNIILPRDVILKIGKKIIQRETSQLGVKNTIIDIGGKTVEEYIKILGSVKTVIWNGPLGIFEEPAGARSSIAIARYLSRSRKRVYIGGGETIEMISQSKLIDTYTFVSTGGGAMLAVIGGKRLPGIEVLGR